MALLILLLSILPAGSNRKELVPWLPLFIATYGLATVALHEVSLRFHNGQSPVSLEDGPSEMSIRAWNLGAARPRAFRGTRLDSLLFGRYGPSSHHSRQTGDSEFHLSDVSGRCQSDWDSVTRHFFTAEDNLTGYAVPGPSLAEDSMTETGQYGDDDDDVDLGTDTSTTHPLLGSQ